MKRILKVSLLAIMFSVLFTGCNSIILSVGEDDYIEIPWEVMENWDEMPDYYVNNDTNKFENLKGDRAFKIKDGHSEEPSDIADFQIGTLLDDGTFLYAYVTKEPLSGADVVKDENVKIGGIEMVEETDDRKKVHCVAAYNYRTGQFKVIHENIFESVNEDEESFFLQLCEKSASDIGDIFVYDNGVGYIYDSSGTLEFQTDIETFIRTHFDKAYSVVTTHALTDGNDKIYLELTIEKEEVVVEENSGEELTEEEADAEAEALEEEFEEQTLEVVFVYDFKEMTSTIDQVNTSFDQQVEAWQRKTLLKEFTSEPDAYGDWDAVKSEYPDVWGTAYLDYLDDIPVYAWGSSKSYITSNEGYVCTFIPNFKTMNGIKEFKDLKENSKLENTFVLYNNWYYEIFADTGSFIPYGSKNIERYYVYTWTETTQDEEGNLVEEKHSERRTQTITVQMKRYVKVSNGYMEGYYLLDELNSVVGVVEDRVLCTADNILYWRLKDGSYSSAGLSVTDDCIVDVTSDDENIYIIFSLDAGMLIVEQTLDTNKINMNAILGTSIVNALTSSSFQETFVDQKYHDDYAKLQKEAFGDFADMGSNEQLSAEKILKADIDINTSRLKSLNSLGANVGYGTATGDGYLITAFSKGLVFYDLGSTIATCLDEGTWYGTWKQGDRYISVGFSNTSASYGTLDVAFARVYEFDLDELYDDALENMEQIIKENSIQVDSTTQTIVSTSDMIKFNDDATDIFK